MDIPVTLLTFVENSFVGVILGASTLAVVSYALCLRYGYPHEGIGKHLIQSIYSVIRVMHIFLAILVVLSLVVFGLLDGIETAQIEYGVKAGVLMLNAVIAFCMAKHLVAIAYTAPTIAAGWYFLAAFHSYTLYLPAKTVLYPLLSYLALLIAFQVLFTLLRLLIEPQEEETKRQ